MMEQIVAIGGASFTSIGEDYPLVRYLLQQVDNPSPRVCFIGTASGDAVEYIMRFYQAFSQFSCSCAHLSLFAPPKDLPAFMESFDLFFVGGGNTFSLLALWRAWGIDLLLRKALKRGALLSGVSAGAICWYEEGLSDYLTAELTPLKSLGFLPGSHCPHYNNEPLRRTIYQKCIQAGRLQAGIAADDGVALHYVDGKLHNIVSSDLKGSAYIVTKEKENYIEERIAPHAISSSHKRY